MNDPFTPVYDAIIKEFKAVHSHIVDYSRAVNPKQDTPSESDLPELALVPDMCVANIGNISCGSDVDMSFQVMLKTGTRKLKPSLFPVMFLLLKAYQRLKFDATLALDNQFTYVTDTSFGQATMDLGAAERGMVGWACLWPITVKMQFSKDDLT